MQHSSDSKQAAAYLIDPLTAPEPSAETGPGTSFRPPVETPDSGRSRKTSDSNNPFRNPPTSGRHSRHASNASNGTPDKFPNYRETALGQLNDGGTPPSYDAATGHRRRGSSLKERYPGDDSHKPLDILRRDSKKAHRSPHLTKRHMPGTDSIDRLDPTISQVPYHHEGPYDAALLSRNTKPEHSPVAALSGSNAEALKATPRENVKNSLDRHVPLDGTAVVPPGQEDRFGRRYNYEEGSNMMLDGDPAGGQYKRYPGVVSDSVNMDPFEMYQRLSLTMNSNTTQTTSRARASQVIRRISPGKTAMARTRREMIEALRCRITTSMLASSMRGILTPMAEKEATVLWAVSRSGLGV